MAQKGPEEFKAPWRCLLYFAAAGLVAIAGGMAAKPFVSSELKTAMDGLVVAGILFIIASALRCWALEYKRLASRRQGD
jgi:hypothetical protein